MILSGFAEKPQNCDIRTSNLADLIGVSLRLRYVTKWGNPNSITLPILRNIVL